MEGTDNVDVTPSFLLMSTTKEFIFVNIISVVLYSWVQTVISICSVVIRVEYLPL